MRESAGRNIDSVLILNHNINKINLFLPIQLYNLPPNHTDLVVTGDDEGIFGVDAQFLYALQPLDREKQPSYSLQVAGQPLLMQFQY